jgi:hypothetical protein
MICWSLIAVALLVALVFAYVRDRWSHPTQPRQDHASRHMPITGVTLTDVVERASVKSHGCPRG